MTLNYEEYGTVIEVCDECRTPLKAEAGTTITVGCNYCPDNLCSDPCLVVHEREAHGLHTH